MKKMMTESMQEFLNEYTPANEHFTSNEEIARINEVLGLESLDRDGLFHLRNEVVMFYSDAEEKEIKYDENGEYAGRTERFWSLNNAMMSVTAVIDHYKYSIGVPVSEI